MRLEQVTPYVMLYLPSASCSIYDVDTCEVAWCVTCRHLRSKQTTVSAQLAALDLDITLLHTVTLSRAGLQATVRFVA